MKESNIQSHNNPISLPSEFVTSMLPVDYKLVDSPKITMDDLIEARHKEPASRREKIISRLKWGTVAASWSYGLHLGIDFGTASKELKDNAPWLLSMYGYGNLLYLLGFKRMYESFKSLGLSKEDIKKSRILSDVGTGVEGDALLGREEALPISTVDEISNVEENVALSPDGKLGFIESKADVVNAALDTVRVISSDVIIQKLYNTPGYRKGLANTAMGFVICSIPWGIAEYSVLPNDIKAWGPSVIGGNLLAAYSAWQVRKRLKPKKEQN